MQIAPTIFVSDISAEPSINVETDDLWSDIQDDENVKH